MITMNTILWWICVVPFVQPVLMVTFVLVAGIIQGRTTGRWPTLVEWSMAMRTVRPFTRVPPIGRWRQEEVSLSSDRGDESEFATVQPTNAGPSTADGCSAGPA